MGLIRAALGATVGTLSDQCKKYFYCEALPANVLVAKGIKRNGRSGNDNIISNGSMITFNTVSSLGGAKYNLVSYIK